MELMSCKAFRAWRGKGQTRSWDMLKTGAGSSTGDVVVNIKLYILG